jgi:hypothetical protein
MKEVIVSDMDCIQARETMEAWRRAVSTSRRRLAQRVRSFIHYRLSRFGLFANSRDVPNYWMIFAAIGALGLGIIIGRCL